MAQHRPVFTSLLCVARRRRHRLLAAFWRADGPMTTPRTSSHRRPAPDHPPTPPCRRRAATAPRPPRRSRARAASAPFTAPRRASAPRGARTRGFALRARRVTCPHWERQLSRAAARRVAPTACGWAASAASARGTAASSASARRGARTAPRAARWRWRRRRRSKTRLSSRTARSAVARRRCTAISAADAARCHTAARLARTRIGPGIAARARLRGQHSFP